MLLYVNRLNSLLLFLQEITGELVLMEVEKLDVDHKKNLGHVLISRFQVNMEKTLGEIPSLHQIIMEIQIQFHQL